MRRHFSRRNSGVLRSGATTPGLPPPPSEADDTEGRLRRTLEKIVSPSMHPAASKDFGIASCSIGVEGENVMEPMSPHPGEVGMVEIKRPVYSQHKFENVFHGDDDEPLRNNFVDTVFVPSGQRRSCSERLLQFVPCVQMLRTYRPKDSLLYDLLSGVSTGIMRIPQSMAYALLAYLSPVYGLYTAFFAGLVYCLLGTSPHLAMSCQGVVSLMVGQTAKRFVGRLPLPGNATGNATAAANSQMLEAVAVISLLVGIFQLLFGLLRLGMVTNYLSSPLIGGFTTGAVIEVVCSQISAIVGFEIDVPKDTPPQDVLENFKIVYFALANTANFNVGTLVLSACSFVFLVLVKVANGRLSSRCKIPIPGELILVAVVTVISAFADFDRFGISQVGEVPQGFGPWRAPPLQQADARLVQDCVIIAVVAFAVAVSIAKKFALEYDTEIDANQEFLAYGAGNVLGSFSNCFVATSSMSCSALHEALGGRSQVANAFASAMVLGTILCLGAFFSTTPHCVLSVIILVNLKGMLWQFGDLPDLWNVSKIDFLLWMVTFVSVVCLSVDTGLLIGIAFSLLTIVFRSQWPYACILGRIPHTDIYKNIVATPDAKEIDGIKIFRYEGSLYFASADHFRNTLYLLTGCNPRQLTLKRQAYDQKLRNLRLTVKEAIPIAHCSHSEAGENAEPKAANNYGAALTVGDLRPSTSLHHVIIDFSCCSFIDSVGMRMLNQVLDDYTEAGVTVFLSNTRAAVRAMLSKTRIGQVDTRKIFLTNHDAVSAALGEAQKIEEKNWLDFDSMARQRMNLIKQHCVSKLPSEIDEAEDFEEQQSPEEFTFHVGRSRRPSSCELGSSSCEQKLLGSDSSDNSH